MRIPYDCAVRVPQLCQRPTYAARPGSGSLVTTMAVATAVTTARRRGSPATAVSLGKAAGKLEAPTVTEVREPASSAGQRIVRSVVVQLRQWPASSSCTTRPGHAHARGHRAWRAGRDLFQRWLLYATGTVESHAGEEIRVASLDSSGRLSKLTPPITIVGDRRPSDSPVSHPLSAFAEWHREPTSLTSPFAHRLRAEPH